MKKKIVIPQNTSCKKFMLHVNLLTSLSKLHAQFFFRLRQLSPSQPGLHTLLPSLGSHM